MTIGQTEAKIHSIDKSLVNGTPRKVTVSLIIVSSDEANKDQIKHQLTEIEIQFVDSGSERTEEDASQTDGEQTSQEVQAGSNSQSTNDQEDIFADKPLMEKLESGIGQLYEVALKQRSHAIEAASKLD